MPAFENILQMVEAAVKQGLLDYEADPAKYDEDADIPNGKGREEEEDVYVEESSAATVKACKRPWWVCQPYVRPLLKEALEKGSLTMSKKERKKLAEDEGAAEKGKLDGKEEGEKVGMGEDGRREATEREKVDREDGLEAREMPRQSMVCG